LIITYRAAQINDIETVTKLSMLLYRGSYTKDMGRYEELFESNKEDLLNPKMAMFLALDHDEAIGFSHVSLRYDYVEGTNGGNVGYLEGIYVIPKYRGHGIAKKLVAMCENWSREKSCAELASDCELENTDSLAFHLNIGFNEVNRIICFTKKL
jgi:aminoglycoside 6'-N-acetyltransferase I